MSRMGSIARAGWLVLAVGSATCVGCGGAEDDLPRQAVTGEVMLDGRPLGQGQISFVPVSGDAGTQVGSPIAAGSYEVAREMGPVPGAYLVRIHGGSAGGDPDDQAKKYKLQPDPVPARYNTRTDLRVEVKADGPNTFNFDLKSE
jgi:hypothetical protein